MTWALRGEVHCSSPGRHDQRALMHMQVVAKNVRMGAADVGGAPGDDAGGFGTDSAISRGRRGLADCAGMLATRLRCPRGVVGCSDSALKSPSAGEWIYYVIATQNVRKLPPRWTCMELAA